MGQAFLRMDVTGNLSNPQVKIQPLPVIKDIFELFGIQKQ
jgi:hypothetical protein